MRRKCRREGADETVCQFLSTETESTAPPPFPISPLRQQQQGRGTVQVTRRVLSSTLPSLAGPFGATSERHLVLARAQLREVRRSTAQSPLQPVDIVFHVHPECPLSPAGPHLSSLTHARQRPITVQKGVLLFKGGCEFRAGLTVAEGSDVGQVSPRKLFVSLEVAESNSREAIFFLSLRPFEGKRHKQKHLWFSVVETLPQLKLLGLQCCCVSLRYCSFLCSLAVYS